MRLRSPLSSALRRAARRARAGFTVIELSFAAAILIVLGSALVASMEAMRDTTLTANVQTKLQESGEKALMQIISDLRRSGQVTVALVDYPFLFVDGNAAAPFAAHWHPAAQQNAAAGEPGFGPSQEIVFLLPQDADLDGVPDLDADAALIWGVTEFSYVLVTGADGINRLERRTNGANGRSVCSSVERVVFDDINTDVTIPVDSVRVRLFLRQRDSRGVVQRWQSEATLRLRNGI